MAETSSSFSLDSFLVSKAFRTCLPTSRHLLLQRLWPGPPPPRLRMGSQPRRGAGGGSTRGTQLEDVSCQCGGGRSSELRVPGRQRTPKASSQVISRRALQRAVLRLRSAFCLEMTTGAASPTPPRGWQGPGPSTRAPGHALSRAGSEKGQTKHLCSLKHLWILRRNKTRGDVVSCRNRTESREVAD